MLRDETKTPDPLCRVGWAFFYTIGTPEQYAALRVQAMQHEQQRQADRQAAAQQSVAAPRPPLDNYRLPGFAAALRSACRSSACPSGLYKKPWPPLPLGTV